jgi:hypothetical protein
MRHWHLNGVMKTYRSVFWLNILSFIVVIALVVYSKLFGPSVSDLFLHPPFSPYFNVALLTHTFQILCAVPPIVCAFTFALLRNIEPWNKKHLFILYSALVTGGFLINEIYRIHIILAISGIPKLVTVMVYAIVAISYGFAFRKIIKTTPYIVLLTGVGLLATGITADSLHLGDNTIPTLLEGIPKLFSEINIALYFWYVCYLELLRSFHLAKV